MKKLIQAIKQLLHEIRIIRCSYILHSDWQDDLIWCPSQCYKHIEYKKKHFVIYLRWRNSDPWTSQIIECIPDGNFNMHSKVYEWHFLNTKNWSANQLNEMKKEVEWHVKDWLISH
jgi:hypothetical protein